MILRSKDTGPTVLEQGIKPCQTIKCENIELLGSISFIP